MMTRKLTALLACAAAFAASAAPALAQEVYPSRTVTMISPFPPGGAAELVARPMIAELQKVLGQPVVLETKAGAAGAVGATYVAKAKPDGYTLLTHITSVSAFSEIDKLFGREAKFQLDELVPIARVNADPTALLVHADTPWKTVKDLLDDAKKRPDQILFSSSGVYGALHLPMALLATTADVKMRHLPTQGGGPAMTALVGRNAEVLVSGIGSATPHIKAGKIRALATMGATRAPTLPDVPTLKELGYDLEYYLWVGYFTPKGTPEPVIKRLREAIGQVAKSDAFKQGMDNLGLGIHYMDQPEFAAFLKADAAKMAKAVQSIGKVEAK